jgi:hypothetical protein
MEFLVWHDVAEKGLCRGVVFEPGDVVNGLCPEALGETAVV